MAKDTGLNFSLFDVASAWEVPFAKPLYIQNAFFMDLPGPSFVSDSALLTVKSVDFVVNTPFVTEIICNFHRGYFDCRSYFQTIDSYISQYNRLSITGNEASSFQTIIGITGVLGAIVLMRYAWIHLY